MSDLELDGFARQNVKDAMALDLQMRLREICEELATCAVEASYRNYASVQVTPYMIEVARRTWKELEDAGE